MSKRNSIFRKPVKHVSQTSSVVNAKKIASHEGKMKNSSVKATHGGTRGVRGTEAIYSPKRTKVKGHQRNDKGKVVR